MENANFGKTACDRIREVARLKHLNLRTEQAYVQWIRRFSMECVRLRVKDLLVASL